MSSTVIEAALKITGQDAGASAILKEVAANLKRVDEAAAHSERLQNLSKQMATLKTQMEAVGQARTAETNLAAMQTRAGETAARVAQLKTEMAAVAAPTAAMARALTSAEAAHLKANAAALKQVETLDRQRKALAEMGVTANNAVHEQERLAKAFQETAKQADLQMRAEQHAAKATAEHARISHGSQGHGGHGGGFDVGGALAGFVAAHSYIHAMEGVLETYREFDKEVRYQRLVMGLTPEQQKPLVEQAIHGGATTQYNDIQWLETQRELAARGYGKDQVMAFAPIAARIGQSFDVSMPEAVKALEGSLLGFHKDTSTMEKAMAAAERTADVQVKAAKIGGFQFDDVTQLYKYGAAPAQMAHLSEEAMLAFGVIAKKSNMNGDEAGVAFRALAKNLISPTVDARTAMLAQGIDFSKYQSAPKAIDLNAFGRDVAMKYGVRLNHGTRSELASIFADPRYLNDPAKFAVAVTNALKETLGKQDAKSLKSIAGDAGKFRTDSAGAVDANGLLAAIMEGMHKNPALANAIFGSKQGGRIAATLGDPELFKKILDEVLFESQGFGQKVADGRMEGFNGAWSKLDGSIMNLKSAIGRAIDNNGEGGFFTITHATEVAGHLVQSLAEVDPKILAFGTAVTGAGAMFGAVKLAGWFTGANALKGSAAALDSSAWALKEAAGALAAEGHGVPGGAGGPVAEAEKDAAGIVGKLKGVLPFFATVGAIGGAGYFVTDAMLNHRDSSKALVDGGTPDVKPWDNYSGLPGVDPDTPLDTAEVAKRAAEAERQAKDAAGSAWGWLQTVGKAIGWGDRLHNDPVVPSVPLPPERPNTLSLPAVVPAPYGMSTVPPPAFHPDDDRLTRARASDAADWLQELGRRERESVFTLGQLNDSASQAATALASLASFSGGGASSSGGDSGFIQAAYHPGGGLPENHPLTPLLRGALPRGGGVNPYAGGVPGGNFVVPGPEASTAGMRQNNMGNIGFFGQHMAGLIGPSNTRDVDHSIAKFATQEDGIRAAAALALGKFHGGRHTIWDIIAAKGGWTPGALGPGASVNIARAMGLGNRDTVNLDDENQMVRFLHGLAVQEHGAAGRWYTEDRIRGALHHEHPALAGPPLHPRATPPTGEAPAHVTMARLEEKMERMAKAVERGSLHRVEIKAHKSLSVQKSYSRGNTGMTMA